MKAPVIFVSFLFSVGVSVGAAFLGWATVSTIWAVASAASLGCLLQELTRRNK